MVLARSTIKKGLAMAQGCALSFPLLFDGGGACPRVEGLKPGVLNCICCGARYLIGCGFNVES